MGPDNRQSQHLSNYPPTHEYVGNHSSGSQISQAAPRHSRFESLPQFYTDQTFLNVAASPSNSLATNFAFPDTMSNHQDNSAWISRSSPLQEVQHFAYPLYLAGGNYHFDTLATDNNRAQRMLGRAEDSSVPRTSPSLYEQGIFTSPDTNLNSYKTESIFQDPVSAQYSLYSNHDIQDGLNDLSHMRLEHSPATEYYHDSTQIAGSHQDIESWSWSPASDDGALGFGETAAVDFDDRQGESDEPYAKLIHKALMSSETHSMVLQDIYTWFRQNTNKGNSESKGWMNSIRHNLSMNAAFKKTERRIPGDETKKSTEWVLEDFAVKDGVQSTTRYRIKGSANKKFHKSDASTTARQSSGRKGGLSAGKTKLRHRVKDECSEPQRPPRPADLSENIFLQQCRSRLECQYSVSPSPKPESPLSPSLISRDPTNLSGTSYEDACGLGNVHLVDGTGDYLFTENREPYQVYFDGLPPYAHAPTPSSGYRGPAEYMS